MIGGRTLLVMIVLITLILLILLLKWGFDNMAERIRQTPGGFPSPKGLLMFFLPLPVLFAAIFSLAKGSVIGIIGNAAGYTLFLVGALLLRRGLLTEEKYKHRQIARTPYPLKTAGSIAIAVATGITAWLGAGHYLVVGVAFGLAALLGCYLNYGLDPFASKRFTDRYGVDTTDQILETLEQAESSITTIEQATRNIRNSELNSRLRRITRQARDILNMLESDPRDLRRARKFLNVYLDGAKQVTEGYANTHARAASPELEDNFRRVLVTIEAVFQEQQQKLLEADVTDLDIQIEVLTTQLKREGVV